jgi:hypothetical protein
MPSEAARCRVCEQPLRDDSAYCGVCGTPTREPEVEAQSQASEDEVTPVRAADAGTSSDYQAELDKDVLAPPSVRGVAWAINQFLSLLFVWFVFLWLPVTLWKYQRGQDIGASIMGVRVMRSNGEVAGFYHMWARNLASIVSQVAFMAGYWTALFDAQHRTWHDKWLDTYVIVDNPKAARRPGTSSPKTKQLFWPSVVVLVVTASLLAAFVPSYAG